MLGYIWSESDVCSIWTIRHLSRLQKECFGRPKSNLFGGVRGVRLRVCIPPGDPSSKNIHKRKNVSYVSNLLCSDFGIRTWKAYNTGPGKLIPLTKFDLPKESELPTMEVRPSTDLKASTSFVPVRPRRTSNQHLATETGESFDIDTMSTVNSSRLFTYPKEGYVKTFRRNSSPGLRNAQTYARARNTV